MVWLNSGLNSFTSFKMTVTVALWRRWEKGADSSAMTCGWKKKPLQLLQKVYYNQELPLWLEQNSYRKCQVVIIFIIKWAINVYYPFWSNSKFTISPSERIRDAWWCLKLSVDQEYVRQNNYLFKDKFEIHWYWSNNLPIVIIRWLTVSRSLVLTTNTIDPIAEFS